LQDAENRQGPHQQPKKRGSIRIRVRVSVRDRVRVRVRIRVRVRVGVRVRIRVRVTVMATVTVTIRPRRRGFRIKPVRDRIQWRLQTMAGSGSVRDLIYKCLHIQLGDACSSPVFSGGRVI